jgi:hypothetical protein
VYFNQSSLFFGELLSCFRTYVPSFIKDNGSFWADIVVRGWEARPTLGSIIEARAR